MTLDEWDLKIGPVLKELYTRANYIYVQAMRLEMDLRLNLKSRPDFRTRFEDEVEITITKLKTILENYREKPLEE